MGVGQSFFKAKSRPFRSSVLRSRVHAGADADSSLDEGDLDFILNTIRGAEALDEDPDFYALLGIQVGAAPEVIKKAYRAVRR